MPAPPGEDAGEAAGCPDAARFGQTPDEEEPPRNRQGAATTVNLKP
jgi:hypothetical protein